MGMDIMIDNTIQLFHVTNDRDSRMLIYESAHPDVELTAYVRSHHVEINAKLLEYGAVLLRNFTIHDINSFQEISTMLTDRLFDYLNRSSPRIKLNDKVFTSTEYPKEFSIPLHNELSYSKTWPNRIFFLCITPALEGGQTPIADSQRVLRNLDKSIIKKFKERGVLYVRHFHENIGMSWQETFQVEEWDECKKYCINNNINYEWQSNGVLKTYNTCHAVTIHPITHEEVWFNQAHLFHLFAFEEEIRNQLLETFGIERLPRNAFYGDGTKIEPSIIHEIMNVYTEQMIEFKWHKSDLLLLDNIRFAHGRMPFSGERKILVTMGDKTI